MSIVLAPVMAPLAVGAFGFTAGFAGTTAATVGFGSLTVGMVSHELLGIYSNWDQMDGAQRLSSVGTMVAGFAGGSTGAQSVRNLPKGFYQKWELNGKLARARVDVRNWRLRSDTWGQPTATTGGLGEFHLEYIGPKANNAGSNNLVQPRTLYHYTDEAGLSGIVESNSLRASTKASNPKDVRYGNGQYVSDFAPGTKTPAQLSREFLGQPFQGKRFTHYIEIDVTGLPVVQGRNGVFVIPNDVSLDLTGRIIGSGIVLQ